MVSVTPYFSATPPMKRSSPAPTKGRKSSGRTAVWWTCQNIWMAAAWMNGSESTSTPSMSKMMPRSGGWVGMTAECTLWDTYQKEKRHGEVESAAVSGGGVGGGG